MKGIKTFIFGALLILIAIFTNDAMKDFISQHIPAVGTSVGIIVIILRAITNSPIFKKS